MIRSFKYRLHPNDRQQHVLTIWLAQCCALYNAALEQRITAYKQHGQSINRYEQQRQLTELRSADPTWEAMSVHAQRSALMRLERALDGFFRRCKTDEKPGFPRFRSERRYDSFTIPRAGWAAGRAILDKNRVHIPKIGHIKLNAYRPIVGDIRDVTIWRDSARRWWIIFACAVDKAPQKSVVKNAIGIDLGLTALATLSNGETIPNPRCRKQGQVELARRQRECARKQKGSANHERARILVAKAYSYAANQRLDHARKSAQSLFERFDLIAHEDLNIRGLASGRLSKSVSDVSWGVFLRCLTSKAESAGKWLVPVDPRGTSQRCSSCGEVVLKTLSEREHRCNCGLVIDRDHNAALNVLALGQSVFASERFDAGEVL